MSKGKAEGEALLAKARKEAEEIVAQANKEAEAIVAKARREAEDLATKVNGDLRMAGAQTLQATRKDIEDLIITKVTDTQVKEGLSAPAFIKEIIETVAKNFNAGQAGDLALVLPESLRSQLEPFVKNELGKIRGGNVEASFSKKIAGGFTIGPKDGSYFISLTDDTFRALIGEYLRPTTKKFLFG